MIQKSLLLLAFIPVYSVKAQVSFGLEAGYTGSKMTLEGNYPGLTNIQNTTNTLSGWHADVQLNIPVYKGLYVQPVIRYTTKGAKLTSESINPEVYTPVGQKLQLHYVELPVNLVYRQPVGNAGRVFVGAGPYAGLGVGGNYKYTVNYNGGVVTNNNRSVKFRREGGSDPTKMYLYPWDFGLNFLVGFEFKSLLTIGANYSLGLNDIDHNKMTTTKNQYVGVSLGVFLSREDY
ncbi:porin family protein [Chitinophaga skermanii]|nr:porin family protein [Chitinophaga skermanii]